MTPAGRFAVLNPNLEADVLKKYKQQRKAGLFPTAAFTHAATEIEWLPQEQTPTRPPIRPLLSEDEVQRLTHVHTLIYPFNDSPYSKKGVNYKAKKADVVIIDRMMADYLEQNGIKADPKIYGETVGSLFNPAIITTQIPAAMGDEIRKLKRRNFPADHPFYGMTSPFSLHTITTEPIKDPEHPYHGAIIVNMSSQTKNPRNDWISWTGLNRRAKDDMEVIPNNTDLHYTIQTHEIGHIEQKEYREQRGINYESDYLLEYNAELYGHELYRRSGASLANIELLRAVSAIRMAVGRNISKEFYDQQPYWQAPAMLSGKNGHLKWPLYRVSAAVTEMRFAAAGHRMGETLDYDSNIMNQLLRETYLRMRDFPARKTDTFFDFKHLKTTFNDIARSSARSGPEVKARHAFNKHLKAHTCMMGRSRTKFMVQGMMSAYRDIWFSDKPLNNDMLLVLGLSLEACGLFRPSLRESTVMRPGEFNFQRVGVAHERTP